MRNVRWTADSLRTEGKNRMGGGQMDDGRKELPQREGKIIHIETEE
jgi:hypothetical protein